ncbi:helix-turn-helix domain-containing protein [Clostridium ihumii]|uniref:helix-turn-helix domain-containing protein n=1 Tax=Clostridium ihumii TaxID=1470356 RepID=UPI000684A061|nr:helix-turn-helix transcriptional regulator [Clostridium ihumii]
MNTLGNRLKKLRMNKNLEQKDLAQILKVHKGTISNWENDKRNPDNDMIVKIANFFNCSTDYLLGRTDASIKTIGDRIHSIRESLNLTGEDFGRKLNVTKVAVSNWENNNRTPDVNMLVNIAKLGNVSVDWLLCQTNIYSNTSLNEDIFAIKVNKKYPYELTPTQVKKLIDSLDEVGFDVDKLIEKVKSTVD